MQKATQESTTTIDARELLRVLNAVKKGDFSVRMPADGNGTTGRISDALNDIIELNERMVKELARIGGAVGKEGRIGQRVSLAGGLGGWADSVEAINTLIGDLVQPTTEMARVIGAVAKGDLSQTVTEEVDGRPLKGEFLRTARLVNGMVAQLGSFASEVTRVAREVGTEGKLGGQAVVQGVGGTWKDLTDSVNSMASNLTTQVRNIAEVTTAVAKGDLSKKITVDVRGEILELKNTANTMVDQLSSFASEVTRVAREVGTEGKLGGQAEVKGVAGTWKDLTDNVNFMASNLTTQVRGIAKVVTAVAMGDLTRRLVVEAKGEIAALADTINNMSDTLAVFAEQVTTVAREVGIEGKLGGQARVPGAAGIWRDLTDNVNRLAANLTNQVRAIAEVATAVTEGDLTRSIAVEAQGEVAALKDNINKMIRNLRDTTRKNTEQDWLKTNLAKFTRMLQGQRDLLTVSKAILSELAPLVGAQCGVFYIAEKSEEEALLALLASYAFRERKGLATRYKLGEGLVGQCALEKEPILLTEVPGEYIRITSGLGQATPTNIVVLPVLFEREVMAVIELASFQRFSDAHLAFLNQLTESIGIVLNTIAANMRTEMLLKQSQALAEELTESNKRLEQQAASLKASEELLKSQQDELRSTNDELQEKARALSDQKAEVDRARQALEEKAEQLTLISKYKSEFLANMSHELRTPLNSLLLLSQMLAENADGNLTQRQVDHAAAIHASGTDLLELINDILDLSKIESGTMAVDVGPVSFLDLRDFFERTFRGVAEKKGLSFHIELDPALPATIETDARRLQQIIKNLLSNAFKFTEEGRVSLRVEPVRDGFTPDHPTLGTAEQVIRMAVTDTGIGIAAEKHQIIFEAFQQADGTTSRRYGGTGLGLSISREIARILGGEIRLDSAPGRGSTFALYLPAASAPAVGALYRETSVTIAADAADRIAVIEAGDRGPGAGGSLASRIAIPDGAGWDRVILAVCRSAERVALLAEAGRSRGYKVMPVVDPQDVLDALGSGRPAAVVIDLSLPDRAGWVTLDALKHGTRGRHLPVYTLARSAEAPLARRLGVIGHAAFPASVEAAERVIDAIGEFAGRRTRSALVVEADPARRRRVVELLATDGVEVVEAGSVEEALGAVRSAVFECIVLPPAIEEVPASALAERLSAAAGPRRAPFIVADLDRPSGARPGASGDEGQGDAPAHAAGEEELLEQACLFLHRSPASLTAEKRRLFEQALRHDPVLGDKHVIVVDDDVRNTFALTSLLERYGMRVTAAEGGAEALAALEDNPDVALVLMDVMMPDMDGYEAIRRIRALPQFAALPVVALTAKAMKEDREKCLAAGASDYITKPVDTEKLLALLRVWLLPTSRLDLATASVHAER